MKSSVKSKKTRKTLFLIALLAYPVLQWAVFWLYVNIQTIALSFQRYNTADGTYEFIWFDNYARLFKNHLKDPTMLHAFGNTFHSIGINAVILPIAVVVAYAFFKKVRFERFFRVAFYLPSMVSVVVLTLCFKYMFNNSESVFVGPAAALMNKLGVNFKGWNVMESAGTVWRLVYVYAVWAGLGTNVIMLSGALNRIPRSIVESGKLDGVGFWRELVSVDLPLIMPTVATFILTGVMSVFSFYMQPMLLSGVPGTFMSGAMYTIPWYIFDMTGGATTPLNIINATTTGLMFSLLMFPIIVLTKTLTDKLTPDVSF